LSQRKRAPKAENKKKTEDPLEEKKFHGTKEGGLKVHCVLTVPA
jgi:hypothetical protein